MLSLLSELALGILTLWLLIKEGIEHRFKKSPNAPTVYPVVSKIDISIKLAVIIAFSVGYYFKADQIKHDDEFKRIMTECVNGK